MDYCSDCRFMTDLGRCRNGSTRRSDVGYFQKACPKGEPRIQEPKKIEQENPKIEQENPKIEHTMSEIEQTHTTKVCKCCGRELPLENFPKQVKSKDGHMNLCRDCFSAKHNHPKANTAAPVLTVKEKTLADFTVDAIVAELRRRGFSGTLTHTVTMEV